MPTLAELRAAPRISRPERTVPLCLAPDLVAELQAILNKIEALAETAVVEDGPPPRMGDEPAEPTLSPEQEALEEDLRRVLGEMAEHEGLLRVRATLSDGDWRQWVNDHPPRGDDQPAEQQRDREVAKGYCNADALLEDLAKYAYAWDGDPLAEGDWATVFEPNLTNPDKKTIAQAVVGMYEQVFDSGKLVRALSATLQSAPSVAAPEPLASPLPSTSAESPQSDTNTTTPTTS